MPSQTKVNYANHYDNTIGMISEFDDTVNVIIIKDKNKKQSLNAITQGQASKVVLLGENTSSDQTKSSTIPKYSLVNQLLKTPAHISIFELLQISSEHKEIFIKALMPNDLDVNRSQNMVRNLVAPHCVSFLV